MEHDHDHDHDHDATEALPIKLRYEATVGLTPDELRASFKYDRLIAWYPDGNPPPFDAPGDEEFEAWPHGPAAIVVRKRVPLTERTPSPYIRIDIEPLELQSARVRARFQQRPPGASLSKGVRIFAGVIAVFALLITIGYGLLVPWVVLHPTFVGTIFAAVAALAALLRYSQNRPKPQSMASFGAPLWGLVGRKLVPHAVGEVEDPFRLQAPGAKPK